MNPSSEEHSGRQTPLQRADDAATTPPMRRATAPRSGANDPTIQSRHTGDPRMQGADDPTVPRAAAGPSSDALAPGDVFDRQWRVVEKLGQGGAGRVYKVLNVNDPFRKDRFQALKILDATADDVTSIAAEISAGQWSHQNLVHTSEGRVSADGRVYMVMDFVPGGTLAGLVAEGHLAAGRARWICEGILHGLHELHRRNVVHRDLKPSNVLIDSLDEGRPKLSDFGISHEVGQRHDSLLGAGTRDFAAPEVRRGEPATLASDIYAFGCMAFHLLLGRLLLPGEQPSTLLPDLPHSACRLLMECIAPQPEQRPQSAGKLLARLAQEWPDRSAVRLQATEAESDIERALVQGRLELVLKNAEIERARSQSTWRIEWYRARALHALGRDEEALGAYESALHATPSDARRPVLADFAKLLHGLGRTAQAVKQLADALEAQSPPELVRLQIGMLCELRRTPEAARLSVDHQVLPDETAPAADRVAVLAGAIPQALDGGLYTHVILCGDALERAERSLTTASAEPALERPDIRAAIGLALVATGDAVKALPHLEAGLDDPALSSRVAMSLWDAWNVTGMHAKAADCLWRVPDMERSLFTRHAEACARDLIRQGDAERLGRVLDRVGSGAMGDDALEQAAEMLLRQHDWHRALRLTVAVGRRHAWLEAPEAAEEDPEPHAARMRWSRELERVDAAAAQRPRADFVVASMVKALGELDVRDDDGGSAAARLADGAMKRGFDSPASRAARFDGSCDFEAMVRDAEALARSGELSDARRVRLLETATQPDRNQDTAVERLFRCAAIDPRWMRPLERLADLLDVPEPVAEPRRIMAALAPLACRPSVSVNDAPERAARVLAHAWSTLGTRGEAATHAGLAPEDATVFVRNCLKNPDDSARLALAAALALAERTVKPGPALGDARRSILRLVADVPRADESGLALQELVLAHAAVGSLSSVRSTLEGRLRAGGRGRCIAAASLAVLAFRSKRFDDASQACQAADRTGNFRLATHLVMGTCHQRAGRHREAIEHFDMAEPSMDDSAARRAAELLGLDCALLLWIGRGQSRRAEGRFLEAAADLQRVPTLQRDREWALSVAESLVRGGARRKAIAFCRAELATSRRSLRLIVVRISAEGTGTASDTLQQDAVALAAARFPWLKPDGESSIMPICRQAQLSTDGFVVWSDGDPSIAERPDDVRLAWRAIAGVLVQRVIATAGSVAEARFQLGQLEAITPPAVWQAAADHVTSGQAATGQAEAARTTPWRGRLRWTGRSASHSIAVLEQLDGKSFLTEELIRHAEWVAGELQRRRFRFWNGTQRSELARIAVRVLDRHRRLGAMDPVLAATLETFAGRSTEASQRLTRATAAQGLPPQEARRAAIRLGLLPVADQRWTPLVRCEYLWQSPNDVPRLVRGLLLALAVIGCVSTLLSTVGSMPRAARGMVPFAAIPLVMACAMLWPHERATSLAAARRLLRQDSPGAWASLVCGSAAVLVLMVWLFYLATQR